MTSRDELGAFLRHRRELIGPADVGLPPGGRRRTPGLRREEVATLAGVSTTWYTWLEQARDVTPSRQVLDALCRTLRLSAAERAYLFTLAGQPAEPVTADHEVHPALRRFVDSLDPHPAFIANGTWDVIAHNRMQTELVTDYERFPPERRNTIWAMFHEPSLRERFVNWEADARAMVAKYRPAAAANPRMRRLTEDLLATSPEFREWWSGHDVLGHEPNRRLFRHPDVGVVELDYVKLACIGTPDHVLCAYVPVDDAAEAKLRTLADQQPARAGALLAE